MQPGCLVMHLWLGSDYCNHKNIIFKWGEPGILYGRFLCDGFDLVIGLKFATLKLCVSFIRTIL